MFRTIALRLMGLLVAAALGVAATGLVLYGFESNESFAGFFGDFGDWIGRRPVTGVAVVVGGALSLLLLVVAGVVLRGPRSSMSRVAKSRDGVTSVDMTGVATSVRRSLRQDIHPQIDVALAGRRLEVRAPVRSVTRPTEFVEEAAAALPGELERRGLPGVKFRVVGGGTTKKRVR